MEPSPQLQVAILRELNVEAGRSDIDFCEPPH
jgi:hypothetical protein